MSQYITIEESGLTFGPFAQKNCFYIEKETEFLKNVARVEFLLRKKTKGKEQLIFLEAKSSIANDDSCFDEIITKFANSLLLISSASLGRNKRIAEKLPENFKQIPWDTLLIKMYLIIPTCPSRHLSPLKFKLQKAIKKRVNCINSFGEPSLDVQILNADLAQKRGLLVHEVNIEGRT